MSFRWRYEKTDGSPVPGPALNFDDQPGAEAWFTDGWEELAEDGVEQVVLLETDPDGADRKVYGPMLLSE